LAKILAKIAKSEAFVGSAHSAETISVLSNHLLPLTYPGDVALIGPGEGSELRLFLRNFPSAPRGEGEGTGLLRLGT